MKPEMLEKIKRDYFKLEKEYQTKNSKMTRLKELEQHPLIQEYLTLQQDLEKNTLQKATEEHCSDFVSEAYAMNSHHIKETNSIFVYLGTYKNNESRDILRGPESTRVKYNDPEAEYRVYVDLEKQSYDALEIPLQNCAFFEQTHRIIFPKSYNTVREFFNLQNTFLLDAIELGQEEAIERVLAKSKKIDFKKMPRK